MKGKGKLSKNNTKSSKDSFYSFPWQRVGSLSEEELIKKLFNDIDSKTLSYASNEKNKDKLVDSALKSLRKIDPENANYEKAIILAEKMQIVARMITTGVKKTNSIKE